jgi:ATP-dependent Lon protease
MTEHTGAHDIQAAPRRPEPGLASPDELAILPLRESVLFPHAVLPLAVARPPSVRLVDEAVRGTRLVGVVLQRDGAQEAPAESDLHGVGTVAIIHRMLKQPDGTIRLLLQGLERFRILEFTRSSPYFTARVERLADVMPAGDDLEVQALTRQTLALFQRIIELSPMLGDELLALVTSAGDAGRMADLMAAAFPSLTADRRQALLETRDVSARLKTLAPRRSVEKITRDQSEMTKTQRLLPSRADEGVERLGSVAEGGTGKGRAAGCPRRPPRAGAGIV